MKKVFTFFLAMAIIFGISGCGKKEYIVFPFSASEIENATHHEELPPARRTVLCVYGAVRGVGGIDSWGSDVEDDYRISAEKDIHYSFIIR